MGVKEVPIPSLIEDKTYLFFSHTIKKQAYNRNLLRAVLDKKIRLIDYEALINEHGHRIVAFGRWAGIVGAYNAIWTYGKRYSLFAIKRVHDCFDFADLKSEYPKVKLPSIKIVVVSLIPEIIVSTKRENHLSDLPFILLQKVMKVIF